MEGHPFFIATLNRRHPLVSAFVAAVRGAARDAGP
jgi:hypothetical protein